MTILQSIVLGIIEGLTEFLPISSTGHLILASNILKIDQTNFIKSFEIIIQLGAISSVIFLYFKSLFNLENIKKLIVGFIPTGIIGFLFYGIIKEYLMQSQSVVLWSLFIGGIIIILFEFFYQKKSTSGDEINPIPFQISYLQALIIGLFQSIAIIPGVSRSASTIIGGLILGLNRKSIVEFSFLLAVPTILIASGYDLANNLSTFSSDQFSILTVGFITAFVTAIAAIKFFTNYIQKHTFIPFAIYRIGLAILIAFFVIA